MDHLGKGAATGYRLGTDQDVGDREMVNRLIR